MLKADVTNNTSSNNDKKPSHYANVLIGTGIDENGNTIYESLGKFGVGLLVEHGEVDEAVIDLFENNPEEVEYLDVKLRVARAGKKDRKKPVKLVRR